MSPDLENRQENPERAVLDRIVDGEHAVLLIGEDETEQVIPADQLPDSAGEGTWLLITRDQDGRIVAVEVDEDSTAQIQDRIASKLGKLRRRGRRVPDK